MRIESRGLVTQAVEHQISIWCSTPFGLACSVNDVVNVLPCATCVYLNGLFVMKRGGRTAGGEAGGEVGARNSTWDLA